MTERIETAIIGGGQAGLAMSYHLSQLGREHIILEEKWPGHRWRTERWDAFAYQHPNWTLQLPGYGYRGDDPDGFAARDEVARFVEGYATFIRAPVQCGVSVTGLRQTPGTERLLVESDDVTFEAANVVVATGPYQRPMIPRPAAAMPPRLFQVHSSGYRNPGQLPPGAVLVVGSGASGSQITEDLREAGRRVYLSVGNHRRTVRRYRGRDMTWWMMTMGWLDAVPPEERNATGVITGVRGGYDIDVRRFPAHGVQLLGHLRGAEGEKLIFALDVEQTLSLADEYCRRFVRSVDGHVQKTGIDASEPDPPQPGPPVPATPAALDLRAAGVTSVIWATGFRYAFGWVHLPVFDDADQPIHRRGVTRHPGLYFLGLRFLHTPSSSFVFGVGRDAAHLAEQINARR